MDYVYLALAIPPLRKLTCALFVNSGLIIHPLLTVILCLTCRVENWLIRFFLIDLFWYLVEIGRIWHYLP